VNREETNSYYGYSHILLCTAAGEIHRALEKLSAVRWIDEEDLDFHLWNVVKQVSEVWWVRGLSHEEFDFSDDQIDWLWRHIPDLWDESETPSVIIGWDALTMDPFRDIDDQYNHMRLNDRFPHHLFIKIKRRFFAKNIEPGACYKHSMHYLREAQSVLQQGINLTNLGEPNDDQLACLIREIIRLASAAWWVSGLTGEQFDSLTEEHHNWMRRSIPYVYPPCYDMNIVPKETRVIDQ
jgi:hypothetical protein